MSSQAISTLPNAPSSSSSLPASNAAAETTKPKPCCVCKEEKQARDECMLFSRSDEPQEDCRSMVDKYKICMKGYGFTI